MVSCKRCGCTKLWKNGIKRGKRRFKCSNCKRATTEQLNPKTETPPCIDCLSKNTLMKGIENGKQRYECKSCGRGFKDGSYSIHFKKSIVRRVITGTKNKDITEKYGLNNGTIGRWLSKYRTEVMTYI